MAERELDHGGIITINAEGDRATALRIGVYQGNGSLVVFSNKQSVARFTFPRAMFTKMKMVLTDLVKAPPGTKTNFPFSKYDPETKKSVSLGNLVVGKDDKSVFFFGVQAPNHPAMKFPMKSPLSFDLSDPMSDADRSLLGAQTIIDQLTSDIPMALMMTSYKRDPMQGGGRSGGGGYSNNKSSGGDLF